MKILRLSCRNFALATVLFVAGPWFVHLCAWNGVRFEGNMVKVNEAEAATPTMSTDVDITPPDCAAVRPDVIKIGNYFYVHILKMMPNRQCFNLIKLDKDLKTLYSEDIYSGNVVPTDARVSVDDKGTLWYAFETIKTEGEPRNYLNAARYDVTGNANRPALIKYVSEIAFGHPAHPPNFPPPGSELMDDPTPFFLNGRYCIGTKTFSRPRMNIRLLSQDFEVLETRSLDLEDSVGKFFLTPSSLVKIDDDLFLITGIFNGPRKDPNSVAKIIAVPLSDDFRLKGSVIPLTGENQYSTYVSSAKYRGGKLFVLYNVMTGERDPGSPGRGHVGMLSIYDPRNNFKLVDSMEINRGIMPDNRTSMEFDDNTLLVFYSTPGRRVMVKKIVLNQQ